MSPIKFKDQIAGQNNYGQSEGFGDQTNFMANYKNSEFRTISKNAKSDDPKIKAEAFKKIMRLGKGTQYQFFEDKGKLIK